MINGKQKRLQVIAEAMEEIARRPGLSPQAKERGLRSLRSAYQNALKERDR